MKQARFLKINLNDEAASILDAALDEVLITDGDGKVLVILPDFEQKYGVHSSEVIGHNVRTLEKRGIFKPSITRKVLESRQKVTMTQENLAGRKIVVSAAPIFDETGSIKYVISFSRDITEFLTLQEQYKVLERKVELYSDKLFALGKGELASSVFFGKSKAIEHTVALMHQVAKFDANILLTGESGAGKTIYARLIHHLSPRSGGELIEVNCAAIPDTLLESELFGYEKGSFTGAGSSGKIGLIELAKGGTLFLDEIGEIPFRLQAKLLKVIQDKTLTRVGATQSVTVDFRLIAATNRNLEELVEARQFRRDLYYRLNVIAIEIPPLRSLKEDIFGLAMYFLENFNQKYGLKKKLSAQAAEALQSYHWPGNVRELENLMERVVLTSSSDFIDLDVIPDKIRFSHLQRTARHTPLKLALETLEKQLVTEAYKKTGTTIGVAKELQISQPSAVRKIQKYGLRVR